MFGNVGALKHIKNRRPSTIIALCGCMMQQPQVADRIRKSFPYVSMVFGTHVIHRFPELLFEALTGGNVYLSCRTDRGRLWKVCRWCGEQF